MLALARIQPGVCRGQNLFSLLRCWCSGNTRAFQAFIASSTLARRSVTKVYVVHYAYESSRYYGGTDSYVAGVFSSKELADKYVDSVGGPHNVYSVSEKTVIDEWEPAPKAK